MTSHPDAVVVGSGPNGLAAALTLARAGLAVHVYEGRDTPGGGCRTAELTIDGFRHDVCSAVHPLLVASPFFRRSRLEERGLRLRWPAVAVAHPLDGGRAAGVVRSVEETAAGLGPDGDAYRRVLAPLVRDADVIVPTVLRPLRSVPDHPLAMARFAYEAVMPARHLSRRFETDEARGLVAGLAGHAMLPFGAPLSGGVGLLLLVLAHAVGWPVVEGGTQRVVDVLVEELESLGGQLSTGRWIRTLDELASIPAVLLDVTPEQLLSMAGDRLPNRSRRALAGFGYGPGVCKVDWALSGPVPWLSPLCRQSATIHVGGTFEEIARSEADVASGRHPEQPYCIVVQPGVIDPTRAPQGSTTLWAYCHVPAGSSVDMTERIEAQIERFAPGFRDLVLERATATADDVERYNPNYVGGDVNGGAATLRQTVFRPTWRWNPYRTGIPGVYLCSSSTPPGGGVHGMCGEGAAQAALADRGGDPSRVLRCGGYRHHVREARGSQLLRDRRLQPGGDSGVGDQ